MFKAHPDAEKVLVVFSDMVETCTLDFGRALLTAERTHSIIEELRQEGRLPELDGVEVWIAGLGSTGQMPAAQAHAIEAFWRSFFEAAGASCREEHVGPTLLNWPAS